MAFPNKIVVSAVPKHQGSIHPHNSPTSINHFASPTSFHCITYILQGHPCAWTLPPTRSPTQVYTTPHTDSGSQLIHSHGRFRVQPTQVSLQVQGSSFSASKYFPVLPCSEACPYASPSHLKTLVCSSSAGISLRLPHDCTGEPNYCFAQQEYMEAESRLFFFILNVGWDLQGS